MSEGTVERKTDRVAGSERDLALVLRDAWCVLRLAALHDLVRKTIVQLRSIRPRELLGRELSSLDEQRTSSPVEAALEACSDELRSESGMKDAPAQGSARPALDVARRPDADVWRATFAEALSKYRSAASHLVKAACDAVKK